MIDPNHDRAGGRRNDDRARRQGRVSPSRAAHEPSETNIDAVLEMTFPQPIIVFQMRKRRQKKERDDVNYVSHTKILTLPSGSAYWRQVGLRSESAAVRPELT